MPNPQDDMCPQCKDTGHIGGPTFSYIPCPTCSGVPDLRVNPNKEPRTPTPASSYPISEEET